MRLGLGLGQVVVAFARRAATVVIEQYLIVTGTGANSTFGSVNGERIRARSPSLVSATSIQEYFATETNNEGDDALTANLPQFQSGQTYQEFFSINADEQETGEGIAALTPSFISGNLT